MGPNCKVQLLTLNDPNFRAIQIEAVLGPSLSIWCCAWSYPRNCQSYDITFLCHQINQVCWLFLFFHLYQWTQICMKELQISLKCNNAKCSWSVNDKSMHKTSLKEEGSEGMMYMMYAEVKMGHLYPTVSKIRLRQAPLHTATWKRGSTSHLLPCSQRHRHWFPQGSAAPTVPRSPPGCPAGFPFNAMTPSGVSTNMPSSQPAASWQRRKIRRSWEHLDK